MAPSADAQAAIASHNGRCETGEFCLYEHARWGGAVVFDQDARGDRCWTAWAMKYEYPAMRRASSYRNLSSRRAVIWYDGGRFPDRSFSVRGWSKGNYLRRANDLTVSVISC